MNAGPPFRSVWYSSSIQASRFRPISSRKGAERSAGAKRKARWNALTIVSTSSSNPPNHFASTWASALVWEGTIRPTALLGWT